MPILAFVLTVGIGSLLYLFASFLFGTSFSDACSALVGFAAMLGVSLVMAAAYRKGFKNGACNGTVRRSVRFAVYYSRPAAALYLFGLC